MNIAALSDARTAGVALSVLQLERLWEAAPFNRHVIVVGGEGEALAQIRVLLKKKDVERIIHCKSSADLAREAGDRPGLGLVVVLPPFSASAVRDDLGRRGRNATLLDLVPSAPRDGQYARRLASAGQPPDGPSRGSLREKLSANEPLRIAMLNDVGFLYGAGVAARRQASSFLLNGWDVEMAAWSPSQEDIGPHAMGIAAFERWHGVRRLRHVHGDASLSDQEIVGELTTVVRDMNPDLVIVGNIHGAGWPLGMLPAIRGLGIQTVVYMHDCYWVTGRCAHAGPCQLFLTGCNETCPTAHLYPRLAPAKIAPAWQEREDIFTGPDAIPLVGNSRWTRDFVRKRFGDRARTTVVHLGLDHHLFAPIPKDAARRLLGVPAGKTVVLMGAVNIRDPYKGGPLFRALHQALLGRDDVAVTLFGRELQRSSPVPSRLGTSATSD